MYIYTYVRTYGTVCRILDQPCIKFPSIGYVTRQYSGKKIVDGSFCLSTLSYGDFQGLCYLWIGHCWYLSIPCNLAMNLNCVEEVGCCVEDGGLHTNIDSFVTMFRVACSNTYVGTSRSSGALNSCSYTSSRRGNPTQRISWRYAA